jgi:hypothetical protein
MPVCARWVGIARRIWRFRLPIYVLLGFAAVDVAVASHRAVWRRYDPDDYLERVRACRREPRDLVVIGGSPVSEGIDPAILAGLQHNGATLAKAFNLGLPGGTVAEFWHALDRGLAAPPRLIIYGITASDLNDSRNEPHGPYSLMDLEDVAAWVTARPQSAEWVIRHYARGRLSRLWQLYRYRNAIRFWATDCVESICPGFAPQAASEMRAYRAYAEAMRRGDGFAPNPGFRDRRLDLLKAAGFTCESFTYLDRFRMGEHLVYFRRIVDWAAEAGVPIVLVDMPVTAELDEGLHAAAFAEYRAWLARVQRELGLRVLRADRGTVGLTDAEFADFIHLNGAGALRLSAWLRGQLDDSLRSVRAEVQP